MSRTFSRVAPFAAVFLAAVAAGCGGNYPVTGKVTYEDGGPVEAGTVIGEATIDGKPVSAQGSIAADGSFTLGTDLPGGGVPPGSYRFAIMPEPIPDGEAGVGLVPAVGGKYTKFDSSGITLDVKPERNELNIVVPRPKGKIRPRGK